MPQKTVNISDESEEECSKSKKSSDRPMHERKTVKYAVSDEEDESNSRSPMESDSDFLTFIHQEEC